MLRVITQFQGESGESVTDDDVIGVLDSSLAAQQAREGGNQQWTAEQLVYGFDQLVAAHLIEADPGGYRLTLLGRFAGESGVHVDSIIRLSSALSDIDAAALKSTTIIAAAQLTVELDEIYIPVNGRRDSPEPQIWTGLLARQQVERSTQRALQTTAPNTAIMTRRAKKAASALLLINGIEMSALERNLNQHVWNRPPMAGVVRAVADRTRDLLPAVGAVACEMYAEHAPAIQDLVSRTITRLEFGIPADLIDLARLGAGLNRQQLLTLNSMGIADLQGIIDADATALSAVVGTENDAEALQATCRAAIEQRTSAEIYLAPPTE